MKVTALLICIAAVTVSVASWDYSDPGNWGSVNAICKSGTHQSPIDIVKSNVVIDKSLHKLQGVNYNSPRDGTYYVTNTGNSLKIIPKINSTTNVNPFMVFNHIAYELAQFHIHWGLNNNEGSEHIIDSKSYPAEIHFVHFNRKYKDLSAAVNESDGLLVFGIIFEVSTNNNTNLDAIIGSLSSIKYAGIKTSIPYTPPQTMFPEKWEKYFHYRGSLTTPGCFESVMWFVNQETIGISEYQLEQMRNLYSDTTGNKKITFNHRPIQNLGTRKVKSIEVDKTFKYLKASKWDYKSTAIGAKVWHKFFPVCKEDLPTSRQSPINIVSADAKYNEELKSLSLASYSNTPTSVKSMVMANNGHAISVAMESGDFPSTVTHKGVMYKLAQYHFHWGHDVNKENGSEHTYDGKSFFGEIHFVHYNSKYQSLGEAFPKSDGLLVWGHFIQPMNGSEEHAGYKKILDNFSKVSHKGKSHKITYFPPMNLIPPNSHHYYTYPGSLTTPNCHEGVTWIVNRDMVTISMDQAKQFLTVFENKETEANVPMMDNTRPIQALNGRKIEKNFDTSSSTSVTSSIIVSFISIILCYLM